MNIAQSFEKLPHSLYSLILEIQKIGGTPVIVGGAVRDFLLTGTFPDDFDMEVRLTKESAPHFYTRLKNLYPDNSLTQLPFEVLRMNLKDISVELAPPREEIYAGQGPFGHSDFTITTGHELDYKTSFSRRDLTINAMGIGPSKQGGEWILIDPFGGRNDLEHLKARHCSENFFKDPVRFTRLVRFCLQFNLTMEPSLKKGLGQFNLSKLTPHYFFKDALKVPFFKWAKMFFSLQKEHNIALNDMTRSLHFLEEIDDDKLYCDREAILKALLLQKTPLEESKSFCRFAGISKKTLQKFTGVF